MIDIRRKRYLDPIAQRWQEWVHDYFFTVKMGKERPWIHTTATGRIYFDTYADEMFCKLNSVVCKYARGYVNLQNRLLAMVRLCRIRFDAILLATPKQMETWVNLMKRRRQPKRLMELIKEVMVPYYDTISKAYGHDLVNALDIKTCPYCNRQYIQTFEGLRAERPELDHFYPKALFPMFCLSFYNLIPVCHSCNHVKLDDEIGVNPYRKPFNSRFVIIDKKGAKLSPSKIHKLTKNEIALKLDGKSMEEDENSQVLGLENVYNKHTDYVKELIDKSMAYDAYARQTLVDSFQGAGYHPRQVFDFVWGRHLFDAEYEDRPLSKLTKDILDLLDIRRG